MDETSPTHPQTHYAWHKLRTEEALWDVPDLRLVILRLGTLYGFCPRMRLDAAINRFCAQAILEGCVTLTSDGEAWRPHLALADACRAFGTALALLGREEKQRYVVASENATMRQVVGYLRQFKPCEMTRGAVRDTRSYRADASQFLKATGIVWGVTLPQGIAQLLDDLAGALEAYAPLRRFHRAKRLLSLGTVPPWRIV